MSTYLNPHLNLNDVLAQAHAKRAQMLGDAIVGGVRVLSTKLGGLYARLQAAQKQRAAVAQLMAMDERMLQDIGLNRATVPFAVTGFAQGKAIDLYADVGVGVTANDNGGLRHAA